MFKAISFWIHRNTNLYFPSTSITSSRRVYRTSRQRLPGHSLYFNPTSTPLRRCPVTDSSHVIPGPGVLPFIISQWLFYSYSQCHVSFDFHYTFLPLMSRNSVIRHSPWRSAPREEGWGTCHNVKPVARKVGAALLIFYVPEWKCRHFGQRGGEKFVGLVCVIWRIVTGACVAPSYIVIKSEISLM